MAALAFVENENETKAAKEGHARSRTEAVDATKDSAHFVECSHIDKTSWVSTSVSPLCTTDIAVKTSNQFH